MQILKAKLDEAIMNDDGKSFQADGADLTYKLAFRSAVTSPMYLNEGGQMVAFQEAEADKYKIGMIAYKLNAKNKVILDADAVKLLKSRISKLYQPALIVRLFDVLEGKGSAEKRAKIENEDDDVPEPAKVTT